MSLARNLIRAIETAADDGMEEVAKDLLERSKRDVPKGDPALDPDPSETLRESGYVRRLSKGVYEVGFASPYAAWQHENQHAKHPRGGKSKFLEDNVKAMIPKIDNVVAAEVRKRTGAASAGHRRSVRGPAAQRATPEERARGRRS